MKRHILWIEWVVTLLLFLTTLASVMGVYVTHFPPTGGGMTFGSTSSSFALIAFAINSWLWLKMLCKCSGACGAHYTGN